MKELPELFRKYTTQLWYIIFSSAFFFFFMVAYQPFGVAEAFDMGRGLFIVNVAILTSIVFVTLLIYRTIFYFFSRPLSRYWWQYTGWILVELTVLTYFFALYLYLMEDGGRRLRSFKGRSSLYQWLKCVATRFFLEKRDRREVIEDATSEPLYPKEDASGDAVEMETVTEDVRRLLGMMRNLRYRMVLERLLIDDMSYEELAKRMETSVANLYNIKKRAMAEFVAIVLREYGNGKD